MIHIKYNLRDLLFYLKSKDFVKYQGRDKFAQQDTECKEHLYDTVKENLQFFAFHPYLPSNSDVNFEVSYWSFNRGMTLDDLVELEERFNKAATGLFGRQYDDSASLMLRDQTGSLFKMSVWKCSSGYDLDIWDSSGTNHLYRITTKDNKLTREQIKQLENIKALEFQAYEEHKKSVNRYEQIKKYADYIHIECTNVGYAHNDYKVAVDKNIPITLTENEIAKYTDGWNYCFGGSINSAGETDTQKLYRVTVNTD